MGRGKGFEAQHEDALRSLAADRRKRWLPVRLDIDVLFAANPFAVTAKIERKNIGGGRSTNCSGVYGDAATAFRRR